MIVLGLTGFAQSGKDTAAQALRSLGFERLAFADALRDAVYRLDPIASITGGQGGITVLSVRDLVDDIGWDRAKVEYPEVRALLQRMGTEVGRELWGDNFWVSRVTQQMRRGGRYVVTDVRFPNEFDAIKALGGHVVRVERPGVGAVNSHVSDTGISLLPVDAVLLNDGSVEAFSANVVDYVRSLHPSLSLVTAS